MFQPYTRSLKNYIFMSTIWFLGIIQEFILGRGSRPSPPRRLFVNPRLPPRVAVVVKITVGPSSRDGRNSALDPLPLPATVTAGYGIRGRRSHAKIEFALGTCTCTYSRIFHSNRKGRGKWYVVGHAAAPTPPLAPSLATTRPAARRDGDERVINYSRGARVVV